MCIPLSCFGSFPISTLGHIAATSVSCFAQECNRADFLGADIYTNYFGISLMKAGVLA